MARSNFREKFGIIKASEVAPPKFLRSGFIRIDDARSEPGQLGFRCGGITVIYGKTGAGKSTLTYQAIANIQRTGTGRQLVIDVENSFVAKYAESRGVDLDRLDILPVPEFMDTALEAARQAILSSEYDTVIVDSIHGQAVQRDAKEGRSLEEEKAVGALPMKITQFIQTTKHAVATTGVAMILIGQARDNMDKYGDPIHLTGGNALKHDADLILQMVPSTSATRCNGIIPKDANGNFDGHIAMVKVEKCRGRGMGKRFDMPFLKSEGFSEERCLVEECATTDWGRQLFNTSGHHYKWVDKDGEEQKINGKPKLLEYFQANPEELARLQAQVIDYTGNNLVVEDSESTETV